MIINGQQLLDLQPIYGMEETKISEHGVSYGLTEAGYDIRLKQEVIFMSNGDCLVDGNLHRGTRFVLASAMEEFQMPSTLTGIVHDKSTWARKGLSVFNTVIEASWRGYLTLELVYHGTKTLRLPKGAGIAQVIFHSLSEPGHYDGKYQDQENKPTKAVFE